ncbi:DUF6478 family protein [Pseudooceanicola aestuarii]|uniref:DUF6478 family protein n=1 Tax=Pseudooceanicola aestuarii TaxID=2697319 RepID=UPI0013D88E61|nr:DUF6478 family protein [Pseudooceanicola aestuarii]
MARTGQSLVDRIRLRREMRRWRRIARGAPRAPMHILRDHRNQARGLRELLDRVIRTAEYRLTLPYVGSNAFPVPHDADWSWRPQLWREPLTPRGMASVRSKSMLGAEASLFHDCDRSELSMRQVRNRRESDLAPFGLRLDVFTFDGTFLSLVLQMPPEAVAGLKRRHLIRMEAIVELEKPLELFARLNIRHGPNTEQLVREVELNGRDMVVEFDLAYSKLNEKRIEGAWLDLIFDSPEMNQIVLRDVTFSRRPRAEL